MTNPAASPAWTTGARRAPPVFALLAILYALGPRTAQAHALMPPAAVDSFGGTRLGGMDPPDCPAIGGMALESPVPHRGIVILSVGLTSGRVLPGQYAAYSYASGNPLVYVDPWGLTPEGQAWGAAIGGVAGAILGGMLGGGGGAVGGTLAAPGFGTVGGGYGGAVTGATAGGVVGAAIGTVAGDALSNIMAMAGRGTGGGNSGERGQQGSQ